MVPLVQPHVVRQEPSGAYYVIDTITGARVYGSFRERDARTRCDRMNRAERGRDQFPPGARA